MSLPVSISRTKYPLDPDDDESDTIRVYYDPTTDTPPMPSVTVIKGLRVDPEKEDALDGWRERFDGQSQWARPWYKDQKVFKGFRGTLIHFAILSELGAADGDTYFHEVGDKEWGHEEYYAEYALKKWSKKAPSANSKQVPYTPRANKYDGEHAWDKAVRGLKWATRAFKLAVLDGKRSSPHFDWATDEPHADGRFERDNVIGVEQFVFDTEYGYGGQYDLLYEYYDESDDEMKTVLGDLKTSSAVRFDHKLQSAAYKRAVEAREGITIDECEIIRLHPDSEIVELSRSPDWDRTLEGLEHEFLGLADRAWTDEYADVLQRAKEDITSKHAQSSQEELTESVAPSDQNTA